MELSNSPTSVFVYGTLKRGQCREHCWPRHPLRVQPAWTLGELFDLGPYPALLDGQDRVLGELWSFAMDDISAVLTALDRVEGTNQPGSNNEYDRVDVVVNLEDGSEVVACTYQFADSAAARHHKLLVPQMHSDGSSYARWEKL